MYRAHAEEESFEVPAASFSQSTAKRAGETFRAHPAALAGKRLIDVIGACFFLIAFVWLFLAVAVAVAVTTGRPVLYRHMRVGMGGRKFGCLKFRSMVPNADKLLEEYLASNAAARQEWATGFKLQNDPRVTPFGRFLRRTSLDELPQFWNVLRGDMSLVGPRPVTAPELEAYYGSNVCLYKSAKPGITGLWQVNGRSSLTYEERVNFDVEYIRRWSLAGDIRILVKTVLVVISGRGSH
jgi:undecaprenyl-phosphate galactose phosphotransferase